MKKNELKYKVGDRVIIEESNIEGICGVDLRGKDVVGTIERILESSRSGHYYWVTSDKHPGGLFCKVKCLASELHTEKIVITHDGKTTTATMYCGDGTKKVATARCAPEDKFDFNVGAKLAMDRLMEYVENSEYTVVAVKFKNSGRLYSYKTKDATAKPGMEIQGPTGNGSKEIIVTVNSVTPGTSYVGEYPISEMKEIKIVEVPLYNGKVVCIENSSGNRLSYTVGKIYQFKNGQIEDDRGTLIPIDRRCNPIYNFEDWRKFSSSTWVEIVE